MAATPPPAASQDKPAWQTPTGSRKPGRRVASEDAAAVCPLGSGQGAGAAQGLWGAVTTGRGQHDLDRGLDVGLPGGVHGHRPGPSSGPDPAAHHLAAQPQRGYDTALVRGPGALGK